MAKHRRRETRITREKAAERFDADGKSVDDALRLILAGGPDPDDKADKRKADDDG